MNAPPATALRFLGRPTHSPPGSLSFHHSTVPRRIEGVGCHTERELMNGLNCVDYAMKVDESIHAADLPVLLVCVR
jgi:hypothetical protein